MSDPVSTDEREEILVAETHKDGPGARPAPAHITIDWECDCESTCTCLCVCPEDAFLARVAAWIKAHNPQEV